MSEVTIDFVDRLVGRFPNLRPIFYEHLSDNPGEVLPHLFFGRPRPCLASSGVR